MSLANLHVTYKLTLKRNFISVRLARRDLLVIAILQGTPEFTPKRSLINVSIAKRGLLKIAILNITSKLTLKEKPYQCDEDILSKHIIGSHTEEKSQCK